MTRGFYSLIVHNISEAIIAAILHIAYTGGPLRLSRLVSEIGALMKLAIVLTAVMALSFHHIGGARQQDQLMRECQQTKEKTNVLLPPGFTILRKIEAKFTSESSTITDIMAEYVSDTDDMTILAEFASTNLRKSNDGTPELRRSPRKKSESTSTLTSTPTKRETSHQWIQISDSDMSSINTSKSRSKSKKDKKEKKEKRGKDVRGTLRMKMPDLRKKENKHLRKKTDSGKKKKRTGKRYASSESLTRDWETRFPDPYGFCQIIRETHPTRFNPNARVIDYSTWLPEVGNRVVENMIEREDVPDSEIKQMCVNGRELSKYCATKRVFEEILYDVLPKYVKMKRVGKEMNRQYEQIHGKQFEEQENEVDIEDIGEPGQIKQEPVVLDLPQIKQEPLLDLPPPQYQCCEINADLEELAEERQNTINVLERKLDDEEIKNEGLRFAKGKLRSRLEIHLLEKSRLREGLAPGAER